MSYSEQADWLVVVAGYWVDPAKDSWNPGGARAAPGGMSNDPDKIDVFVDRALAYVQNFKCGMIEVVPFNEVNKEFYYQLRIKVFEAFKEQYPELLTEDGLPRDDRGDIREIQPGDINI